MTETTVTLTGTSQRLGNSLGPAQVFGGAVVVDSPSTTGGGSVLDDSDASYLTMSAWQDPADRMDSVDALFTLPSGYTPLAFVVQIRARTPPANLNNPATDSRDFYIAFGDAADAPLGESLTDGLETAALLDTTQADAAWMNLSYGGPMVDLDNPTEAGNWIEPDATWPGVADALTGTGLRVAFFPASAIGTSTEWVDLFEMRLLVHCEVASVVTHAPPCRKWPRSDRYGVGGRRIWPPPTYRQSSGRRGPESTY